MVFARAVGAHREAGHGGAGAVVGQRGDDGEARAAVGAVDEGVPVAPVGRVALFGGAFGAHGDVGGGERAAAVGPRRVRDREAGAADDRNVLRLNRFDDRQRRGVVGEPGEEVVEIRGVALDLDDRAGAVVAHRTGQAERGGAWCRRTAGSRRPARRRARRPAAGAARSWRTSSESSPRPISFESGHARRRRPPCRSSRRRSPCG